MPVPPKNLAFFILDMLSKDRVENLDRWMTRETLVREMKSKDHELATSAYNLLLAKSKYYNQKSTKLGESNSDYFWINRWTDFSGNDFSGVDWRDLDLHGVGKKFMHCVFSNADLRNSNLQDTVFDYSLMRECDFSGALMVEVNMIGVQANRARFQDSNLKVAHLHGADFSYASFTGSNLMDARMREANLFCADLSNTKLEYADLTNANLEGASFAHADWGYLEGVPHDRLTTPTLPDGTRYTPDIDLRKYTDPGHKDFWRPSVPVVWGDGHKVRKRESAFHLDLGSNPKY